MVRKEKSGSLWIVIAAAFLISSCVIIFRTNTVESEVQNKQVKSPIKVHMKDGRTALFRSGATFSDSYIEGNGEIYSIDLKERQMVDKVDRSNVAAYEVFEANIEPVSTIITSAAATTGAFFGVAILSLLLFGSCPTVYAMSDTAMVLESELFSNSIAPMLEKRDVTDLHAQPDDDGILRIEIRNEALETHYINQMELLEVSKLPGEKVVPDSDGRIYALQDFEDPLLARQNRETDIRRILAERDSLVLSSTLRATNEEAEIQWDFIDLEFAPAGTQNAAIYLELRNSLFPTVLLYDYLLGAQGLESLDWIGKDLETVSGAVALGDFNHTYMGLRIQQKVDGVYREIGRIPNTGPIAPRELAVPIKVQPEDTLKLRLKYLADSWRINKLKLAKEISEPDYRYVPVASIENAEGIATPENLHAINSPDEHYIVTTPGDRFTALFETRKPPGGYENSYLLAGQGYYIEWIRKNWIENKQQPEGLQLTAEMVVQAQGKWKNVKDDFEQQFFESRIPVQ